jgi:hypothetical protein
MRLRRTGWTGVALGGGALLAITVVVAQVGGGYDAGYTGATGGGGTASSGSYVLQNAIGQPIAGNASGGAYSLDAGLMAGGVGAPAASSPTASPSPSPAGSPSPGPSPSGGPIKRYAPQVANDGVY